MSNDTMEVSWVSSPTESNFSRASTTERTEPTEIKEFKEPKELREFKKGLRFWMIFLAIALCGLLTAMEATIVSTALPKIISDIDGGDNYFWVANGYFLTNAALMPMFGQIANVFGRRWPLIISTAAFTLGSGICGGAINISMLIAGRVIQGAGGAGINVLVETIVCDLVPLRERGNYMSMIFGLVALGTSLGPFFGGLIVAYSSWRWVFYMIMPVSGLALIMCVAFLHVNYDKSSTLATKVSKLDWLGNIIFIGASSSVLIALGWAGAKYEWSSYQVIVPLVVGMVGLVGFLGFETTPLAPNAMMPLHLFTNRTSSTTFVLTFVHGLVTVWAIYFLPVYFQGVLIAAPDRSGVMLLPTILVVIPAAIVAGTLLTKFGKYRPILGAGFAFMAIGFGLFSLFDKNSSTGLWVGSQIINSFGAGLIIPTLLPAVLAPLAESDTALATGTFSFMRSFGSTWGATIPAAIFNNRVDQLLRAGAITDSAVVAQLIGGKAYQHATADFLNSLGSVARVQFSEVLNSSLQQTWYVAIAFAIVGFLGVGIMKEIPLRKELDNEFGMVEDREKMVNLYLRSATEV